ncbi:MAG TPA: trypsin-like serine protease [Actinomycetota bacterium]
MRTRAASIALAAALLVAAVLTVPGRALAADTRIQPGARIVRPAGCTLNFVFRDAAARLYIGTAGHCVSGVGDRVATPEGEFGTVVFRILRGDDDFSLIRIDPAFYAEVNPAMRAWGGPTGVTTADTTGIGDALLQYGYGIVYSTTEVTRARGGILYNDNAMSYHAEVPAIFGDSGGPVIHAATGRALGIVANIGGHLLNGPTVQRAIELLAEAGIDVSLATAGFTPPA